MATRNKTLNEYLERQKLKARHERDSYVIPKDTDLKFLVKEYDVPAVLMAPGLTTGDVYFPSNKFKNSYQSDFVLSMGFLPAVPLTDFDNIFINFASETKVIVIGTGLKLEGTSDEIGTVIHLNFLPQHRLGFDTDSVLDFTKIKKLGFEKRTDSRVLLDDISVPVLATSGKVYPICSENSILTDAGYSLFKWLVTEGMLESETVTSSLSKNGYDLFTLAYEESETTERTWFVVLGNSKTSERIILTKNGVVEDELLEGVTDTEYEGKTVHELIDILPKGIYSSISNASLIQLEDARFVKALRVFKTKVRLDDVFPDEHLRLDTSTYSEDSVSQLLSDSLPRFFDLAVEKNPEAKDVVTSFTGLTDALPEILEGWVLRIFSSVGNLLLFVAEKDGELKQCKVLLNTDIVAGSSLDAVIASGGSFKIERITD